MLDQKGSLSIQSHIKPVFYTKIDARGSEDKKKERCDIRTIDSENVAMHRLKAGEVSTLDYFERCMASTAISILMFSCTLLSSILKMMSQRVPIVKNNFL